MHALIIEERPFISTGIQRALREIGYRSFTFVVTAAEAVAAAERESPDLVLSVIRTNISICLDAVQIIWAKKRIPVVFVTGEPRDVQNRMADAFVIEKPFTSADIQRAVRRATAGVGADLEASVVQ